MTVEDCVIISKKNIAKGVFDIWVKCPQIVAEAKAGQFIDVKCDNFTLRRPISICDIDNKKGQIRLVFEIRGEGTDWLAAKNVGDCIDLLGPLGNGFFLGKTDKPAVFVGGGIGVPPLLAASKPFGANATAILGFRSACAVILKEDYEHNGASVTICTDDGTAGRHGLVTVPLEERLDAQECAVVFACGPKQMLKAVARICDKRGVMCFVSMEERMACGVGACLSCACKVKYEGEEKYFHVCKNGPVFNAKTIVW
jgi:dihydroorotate dehydrogenase electron transfer subunit